jgi:hypothetical protein
VSDDELDALLAELPSLEIGALLELAAAHGSIEPGELESARTELRATATRLHRRDEVDRLRQDIARWAAGASESRRWLGETSMGDLQLADVRRAAVPAAVDAATALLVGRALDEATRELLLGPWRRIHDPASGGDDEPT